MLTELRSNLHKSGNAQDAAQLQSYFKTGPGEYGGGDVFIGVRVPVIRKLARKYCDIPVSGAQKLLISKIHEERLLALILLIAHYKNTDDKGKKSIYTYYLNNTNYINNWDLVDISAEKIVGAYLFGRSRQPLNKLARSTNLWERRIAIMSTLYFIRHDDFSDTLYIAEKLLMDDEDLIHKAVGWMLREVGNRDRNTEEQFLKQHYHSMPRTMLRYAIEKFPQSRRRQYLEGKVKSR